MSQYTSHCYTYLNALLILSANVAMKFILYFDIFGNFVNFKTCRLLTPAAWKAFRIEDCAKQGQRRGQHQSVIMQFFANLDINLYTRPLDSFIKIGKISHISKPIVNIPGIVL